tara:strand:- start:6 stop:1082 length:1077 start_codon:yes stop_codon:yes gene_type:complete
MNLISALISLISYAVGDIHISNEVYTNIQDVHNDSYYEFEINKNGEIQKMLFVLKGNVSVAPEVKKGGMFGMSSKKYYLKNTTEASILYNIVSEKGHLGMLNKIHDFFKKRVQEGKGIDDIHLTSGILVTSCKTYSMMNSQFKNYCTFLESFFKRYIDDLDNKTLAYMADIIEKCINLLKGTIITIDNIQQPKIIKLDISKQNLFRPVYESMVKNVDFVKLDGGKTHINIIGYIIHKDKNMNPQSTLEQKFKSYDTIVLNTAINAFNTSIMKLGFSNVIGDIKHTLNELSYYDSHKASAQPQQPHGGKRKTRKNRKYLKKNKSKKTLKKNSKKRISRKVKNLKKKVKKMKKTKKVKSN